MAWINDVLAMKPGDPCEYRHVCQPGWHPGVVVVNGGTWWWHIDTPEGEHVAACYAEHIRAPGGEDCHGRTG